MKDEQSYPYNKTFLAFGILQNKAGKIFEQKLADYGTKDLNSVDQITARIKEKIGRVENLLGKKEMTADESILDTLLDVANYALIGASIYEGTWGSEGERLDDKILISREPEAKEFTLPHPKKPGDVGHDLYTIHDTEIPANNQIPIDVRTGVRIKLPQGKWALIINRSSTPRQLGIEVVNGVIDEGYTGELFACVYNRTDKPILIPRGTRLAQFLIFNAHTPDIREVDGLPDTARGDTGFGSTGT